MLIHIDDAAGFCWGVVRTIDKVEEVLQDKVKENIYVLGEIIHNPSEIQRLEQKGLKTITHAGMANISPDDSIIIIRAHGEPPSTYSDVKNYNIELVDATCPLVTALQKTVRKYYVSGYQIVIYGKNQHAEIIGLRGVCNDECIVIQSLEETLQKVDFSRKTILFSQTTMDRPTFNIIKDALRERFSEFIDAENSGDMFLSRDTICKYVSGREENLIDFSGSHDIVIFVAGKSSSNGKSLYKVCKSANQRTYFIESIDEIDYSWFDGVETVGITGATSTPDWYLKLVKEEIVAKC